LVGHGRQADFDGLWQHDMVHGLQVAKALAAGGLHLPGWHCLDGAANDIGGIGAGIQGEAHHPDGNDVQPYAQFGQHVVEDEYLDHQRCVLEKRHVALAQGQHQFIRAAQQNAHHQPDDQREKQPQQRYINRSQKAFSKKSPVAEPGLPVLE